MKYLVVLFITVLLYCSDFEKLENINPNNIEKKIVYLQDTRTGICFAFSATLGNQMDSQTMTCVPCENIPDNLLRKGYK